MARKQSFEVGDTVIIHAKITSQDIIDNIADSVHVDSVHVDGLDVIMVQRADLVEKRNAEKIDKIKCLFNDILEEM